MSRWGLMGTGAGIPSQRGPPCSPRRRRKTCPTRVRRVSPLRAVGEPYQYLRERRVRVEHRQKILLPVALLATAFAASDRRRPFGQLGKWCRRRQAACAFAGSRHRSSLASRGLFTTIERRRRGCRGVGIARHDGAARQAFSQFLRDVSIDRLRILASAMSFRRACVI